MAELPIVIYLMEKKRTRKIIVRERRSYLIAASCSAVGALLLFYKLMQNDLYLKILNFKWIAAVLFLLIVGNIIHGFFALKSWSSIEDDTVLEDLIKTKITFYKSLVINFFIPYILLIILFFVMKEYFISTIASCMLLIMSMGCYYFDLLPTLRQNKKD